MNFNPCIKGGLLLSALALILPYFSSAQAHIRQYVRGNTVPIRCIDPDSTDFTDLEALGRAIGEARVVMLGEQDHGDAPTFLAKTRLIKYLHERKGFNVLAFESDFFGLNEGWPRQKTDKSVLDSFIRSNVFTVWTYCHTCKDLFYKYLPSAAVSPHPLIAAGFDSQMFLSYSKHHLVKELDSLLRLLDLPVTHRPDYTTSVLPQIDSLDVIYWYNPKKYAAAFSIIAQYLGEIKKEAASKLSKDDFWTIVIESLCQENAEYIMLSQPNIGTKQFIHRDYQMARNLKWLVYQKFPTEKVIVWAANAHIARMSADDAKAINADTGSMGSYFTEDSSGRKETYIIGFTSCSGTAGRLGMPQYNVQPPWSNSLESWIDLSLSYAFIDFRKYNSMEPGSDRRFYMSGFGHYNTVRDWNNIYDGVFFIRDMYPCKAQ